MRIIELVFVEISALITDLVEYLKRVHEVAFNHCFSKVNRAVDFMVHRGHEASSLLYWFSSSIIGKNTVRWSHVRIRPKLITKKNRNNDEKLRTDQTNITNVSKYVKHFHQQIVIRVIKMFNN